MLTEPTLEPGQTQEVLLRLIEGHSEMARHSEDQRATMTNFLVTIAAALVAFVSQQQFAPSTRIVSAIIIVIGVFGLLASLKYAQHFHLHYSLIKRFQQRLNEVTPEVHYADIRAQAINHNQERYPIMRRRIAVITLWLFLHGAICVIGVVSLILSFI